MKAIVDERQVNHDPKHFLANGRVRPNPEQPERITVLRSGAIAAGCEFEAPDDAGILPIAAVHSSLAERERRLNKNMTTKQFGT